QGPPGLFMRLVGFAHDHFHAVLALQTCLVRRDLIASDDRRRLGRWADTAPPRPVFAHSGAPSAPVPSATRQIDAPLVYLRLVSHGHAVHLHDLCERINEFGDLLPLGFARSNLFLKQERSSNDVRSIRRVELDLTGLITRIDYSSFPAIDVGTLPRTEMNRCHLHGKGATTRVDELDVLDFQSG